MSARRAAVAPPPPKTGERWGRGARVLMMRPPIALGGHCFVVWTALTGELFERCIGCHVTLPAWAVAEGLWAQHGLARLCPDLLVAIEAHCGHVDEGDP